MQEPSHKEYERLAPFIKREYLRLSQKEGALSQYKFTSIPTHKHDNISSAPISYTTISGVKNFLVSNTIKLSPTQILALHTTPIVLIANPGTRSFVYVDSVAARLTFGTTAYTGTNSLHFSYTNAAGLPMCGDIPASFINSATNAYAFVPAITDIDRNLGFEFTPVGGDIGNNGQIVVSVPNANPATGNSTITLVVYYRVIAFST